MKQLKTACIVLGVMSLLLGIIYPLAVTGIAQLFFPFRANGSLIRENWDRPAPGPTQALRGPVPVFPRLSYVGSALIGQSFSSGRYFHGRPSDCDYDGANSSSSNLGPSNLALMMQVRARIDTVRIENGLPGDAPIPADLVLASSSGLDPEITPASALLQVGRVARERNLAPALVRSLVLRSVEPSFLGIFGRPRVNVLQLNLALDSIALGNDEIRSSNDDSMTKPQ